MRKRSLISSSGRPFVRNQPVGLGEDPEAHADGRIQPKGIGRTEAVQQEQERQSNQQIQSPVAHRHHILSRFAKALGEDGGRLDCI